MWHACTPVVVMPNHACSTTRLACTLRAAAAYPCACCFVEQRIPCLHECRYPTPLCRSGVHLIFEAEGSANPLDSPSVLFVTVRIRRASCLNLCLNVLSASLQASPALATPARMPTFALL